MSASPIKSVIITGGNGFVGRHLIRELQNNWVGVKIVVWDTAVSDMPAGVEGIEVDITTPDTYTASLQAVKPDWLVHLAAIASNVTALKDPELTKRVNVDGTRMLLESVKQLSPDTKVFVTSTSDMYGANQAKPLSEMTLDQCKPPNPYAMSKWEMEKVIEKDFRNMVLRVRPFPHIGPGQGKGFVTADFASQVADIETGKQEPVMKVGNLTAQRDFTDVRDVVRAYRLLMEKGSLGEVYNIGSSRAIAVQAILDGLLSLATVKIAVEQDPARVRPSDTPILFGDTSKLQSATGWQPEIPLDQTLREILDYWRSKSRTS